MQTSDALVALNAASVDLKRRRPRPLARIESDGRISVRICAGVWTVPMERLPIALFTCLAPWQQEQISEGGFTLNLNRGFVQAKA
jgi:hypothetical protein